MPAPKPVREMTQLVREIQKDGDTNKLKQYQHIKYKARQNKTHSAQPGCMNWSR